MKKTIKTTLATAIILTGVITPNALSTKYFNQEVQAATPVAYDKTINIKDYGAIPNDGKDDTTAITKALEVAKTTKVRVNMPAGTYDTKGPIKVTGIKNLYLDATLTTIDYTKNLDPSVDWNEEYIMDITGESDATSEIYIDGLHLDGHKNKQQNYHYVDRHPELISGKDAYGNDIVDWRKVPIVKGLKIDNTAKEILNNPLMENWYGGRVIHSIRYHDVTITNPITKNIGAFERENIGDHIHFGGHKGNATMTINGGNAIAKKNLSAPKEKGGWIGVVYENGFIQDPIKENWQVDDNTNLLMTNYNIDGFQTGIHIENAAGNFYRYTKNVSFNGSNYLLLSAIRGETRSLDVAPIIKLTPDARNTYIHGVYHSQSMPNSNGNNNKIDFYNAFVDRTGDLSERKYITGVYGNGSTANFYNSTFVVPNLLVANGNIKLQNSVVNTTKDNHRTSKESLIENGSYISTTGTTFNFQTDVPKKATPTTTIPAIPKNTGHVAPPFTTTATPGI